ncbi:MAG TPA: lysylphosphatidylglycerol synthase transmembrane domain-containing protein [Gaiellaceae bacterium]|nr:lysylphosphatidylglycerol synthase transmembrane domain-containing protein [Gaiellaceae bacterium]
MAAERAHEIFGIDRRKAVLTVALGVALVAGAVAGIGQIASFHRMLHALDRADGEWFPVCLGGELIAYAGFIAAYRDVARVDGGPCFSFWTATRVVVLGFGAFIVATSAGSLGLDFWALHRAGEPPRDAFRRVLALNTVEWMVLAILAFLSAAVVAAGWGSAPPEMELAWLAIVPACILAAVWVSSPRRSDRLASLPGTRVELARDPRTWPAWVWHTGRGAFSESVGGVVIVRHLLAQPRRHAGGVLGFAVFWTGDILTLYAALRAFGVHPPLPALVLAYSTAYVVTMLPLPAGGSGGIEAGIAFSLNAVGIPLAQALVATLVYRVFTLWLPIVPAALALTQVRALEAELPTVGHASIA